MPAWGAALYETICGWKGATHSECRPHYRTYIENDQVEVRTVLE